MPRMIIGPEFGPPRSRRGMNVAGLACQHQPRSMASLPPARRTTVSIPGLYTAPTYTLLDLTSLAMQINPAELLSSRTDFQGIKPGTTRCARHSSALLSFSSPSPYCWGSVAYERRDPLCRRDGIHAPHEMTLCTTFHRSKKRVVGYGGHCRPTPHIPSASRSIQLQGYNPIMRWNINLRDLAHNFGTSIWSRPDFSCSGCRLAALLRDTCQGNMMKEGNTIAI